MNSLQSTASPCFCVLGVDASDHENRVKATMGTRTKDKGGRQEQVVLCCLDDACDDYFPRTEGFGGE